MTPLCNNHFWVPLSGLIMKTNTLEMKKKQYNCYLKRWALGTLRRDMNSSEVAQFLTSRGTLFSRRGKSIQSSSISRFRRGDGNTDDHNS